MKNRNMRPGDRKPPALASKVNWRAISGAP
jgi:hypothetical protein